MYIYSLKMTLQLGEIDVYLQNDFVSLINLSNLNLSHLNFWLYKKVLLT